MVDGMPGSACRLGDLGPRWALQGYYPEARVVHGWVKSPFVPDSVGKVGVDREYVAEPSVGRFGGRFRGQHGEDFGDWKRLLASGPSRRSLWSGAAGGERSRWRRACCRRGWRHAA